MQIQNNTETKFNSPTKVNDIIYIHDKTIYESDVRNYTIGNRKKRDYNNS